MYLSYVEIYGKKKLNSEPYFFVYKNQYNTTAILQIQGGNNNDVNFLFQALAIYKKVDAHPHKSGHLAEYYSDEDERKGC